MGDWDVESFRKAVEQIREAMAKEVIQHCGMSLYTLRCCLRTKEALEK